MSTAARRQMTREEYLAFEETAETKHEFVNGEVIAMAGASPEHSYVREEISFLLNRALRRTGSPCQPVSSDTRVRITETGLFAYPDVTVVCGKPEFDRSQNPPSLLNPIVIFEVLPRSTEAFDRGGKSAHYRARKSLQEYVLVSTVEQRMDLFRRRDDSGVWWETALFQDDSELPLESLGITLSLPEVFAALDRL